MVCCLRLLRAIKSLSVKEPLLQECRKGYSLEKKFCTGQGVQEKKFAFNCILHSPRNPALSFHYRRQPVFFCESHMHNFFGTPCTVVYRVPWPIFISNSGSLALPWWQYTVFYGHISPTLCFDTGRLCCGEGRRASGIERSLSHLS